MMCQIDYNKSRSFYSTNAHNKHSKASTKQLPQDSKANQHEDIHTTNRPLLKRKTAVSEVAPLVIRKKDGLYLAKAYRITRSYHSFEPYGHLEVKVLKPKDLRKYQDFRHPFQSIFRCFQ